MRDKARSDEGIVVYLRILEQEILLSRSLGRPGDWGRVLAKLDELKGASDADPETAAPSKPPPPWRAERDAWIQILHDALVPEVLDQLAELMRYEHARELFPYVPTRDGRDANFWAGLAPEVDQGVSRHLRLRQESAQAWVDSALKRYANTPSYSRLREVLRAVIDLQERKKHRGSIDEDVIEYELTRLSAALRILMPARAQRLLVSMVADRVRSMFETEASGERQTSPEPLNVLSELEAQQKSLELQTTHRLPESPGVWFVDSVRTVYEREVLDEVRRERVRREEEEQKRLAAVAEDQRRQDEEAEREEEAAKREEETRQEITARRAEQARVEREAEQRRLEHEAQRQEELRWARKLEDERRGQEKRALRERTRIRKDHRNHLPSPVPQANRDRVRQFLKVSGITPADLTPQIREAFRREFRW